MALTRRDVCILLPALMGAVAAHGAEDVAHNDQALKSAIYQGFKSGKKSQP